MFEVEVEAPVNETHEIILATEAEADSIIREFYPDAETFSFQFATDYLDRIGRTMPDETGLVTLRVRDADIVGRPDYPQRLRARMLAALKASIGDGPGAAEVAALAADAQADLDGPDESSATVQAAAGGYDDDQPVRASLSKDGHTFYLQGAPVQFHFPATVAADGDEGMQS